MKVLVGIVSKNRCEILSQAIDSALNQVGIDVSIAVYDDHSGDETYLLKEKYPGIEWEFGKEGKGLLYARNKMMKDATADYYCSLDDDSWFMEIDGLHHAIGYLEEHGEVAAVALDILSHDHPNKVKRTMPFETNTFIGCGHVLRLKYVREIGFYEPNPGYYGGEKDLSIRLMDRGYKIAYLPGVHIWHDKTDVARDMNKQHRSGVCNDLVFGFRRTPLWLLFFSLPVKIAKHLWFAIRFERGRFLRACVLGIEDFLRLIFLSKISRKPVSEVTFRKFITFNQAKNGTENY